MWSRLYFVAWMLVALMMLSSLAWLPERVGDPGHELSRGAFVGVMLASLALAGGACSPAFIGWLGRYAPAQISLPNATYWLTGEHRAASLDRLTAHVCGVGWMTMLLLGGVHLFALLQGRPDWPQPPRETWPLGAALLGLWFAAWTWQSLRLFPPPPPPPVGGAEAGRRPRRPGNSR